MRKLSAIPDSCNTAMVPAAVRALEAIEDLAIAGEGETFLCNGPLAAYRQSRSSWVRAWAGKALSARDLALLLGPFGVVRCQLRPPDHRGQSSRSALDGTGDGGADRLQHSESSDQAWSVSVLRDREMNNARMATLQLLGDRCTNAVGIPRLRFENAVEELALRVPRAPSMSEAERTGSRATGE